ncbi:hypothetical protein FNH05_30785 [Amycolatopsis rhizosphaerae]|uniref:ESX-1 secretion-associated protein n=1 Tax=Amycolatopsis rhizosphaerae TaxID=2053003 RepID=A0A558ATH0_9PSEU|nr:type VII secretion target [Amycolatopsis rhizosphaerae]TVT27563.1 hypothetical protein FNH05_30785 [Amycolatopsis rhizosphaerae]
MADGFHSTPEDLAKHSATVTGLGERLRQASATGGGVDVGGETFGIIGQAFAFKVKGDITETAGAISDLAVGLTDFGEGVGLAGQNYEQVEGEIQELLTRLKAEL